MYRNSVSLLVNAGHVIVYIYFLSVSVNTSHWEICHCHLSTVYHRLLIKTHEKKNGRQSSRNCLQLPWWCHSRCHCLWMRRPTKRLRHTHSVTRVQCVCVCVSGFGWVGGRGRRCSECVQESHWRFLPIFAAATFFVATFSTLYTDGGCRGMVLNLAEFKPLGLTHPPPRKTEPPESQINK